ncbi:MAG: regulatory protein RecX [Sporomusa sp.]
MDKKIVEAAVKLLSVRAYSRYELQQKLLKQSYDQLPVNKALDYVTERGYLNDAALCNALLTRYAETGRYSLKEIFIKLRRKGLPATLIKDKLDGWDEDFEYQTAYKLALKYTRGDKQADRQKVTRRLAAKGFKAATINRVLEQLS